MLIDIFLKPASKAIFSIKLVLIFCLLITNSLTQAETSGTNIKPGAPGKTAIVLHGGAGTILRAKMTPSLERSYKEKLKEALLAGSKILGQGGSSIEAVKAAIIIMEDSPLFNAGKGAVFTHEGTNALDASIMSGEDLSAGAVAGVMHIKNPILLADKIRTDSVHVMMTSEGAEEFAQEQSIELVDPGYFYTERRWKSLQKALKDSPGQSSLSRDEADNMKYGTVGAVALDKQGQIAAGTSTGGMTNKRYGRIGDSPIIGAGNYANNLCGISATGHGEYFIRAAVAHDICALVEYKGLNIQSAANQLIHIKLKDMGGTGGVIGLDSKGNIMTSFNTAGMYRASLDTEGNIDVRIFNE